MAEAARTQGLEALLEKEVLRLLRGESINKKTRSRLRKAVRGVLRADELTAAESKLAGSGDLDGAALDEALGLRIQRAMGEALKILRSQGHAVPDAPPVLRVVRTTSAEDAATRAQTFSASMSMSMTAATEERDTLVLTDRSTYGALQGVLEDADFRAGGAAVPAGASAGASEGMAVVEAEDALAAASESLRVARKPSAPTADDDALVGQVLGSKYRIVKLKGRGGFGTVYEAVDSMLGATVAVKVLNEKAARSPTALQEFLAEARRITSLDHENIVRWITFDTTPDGLHYFVMEYLAGEELDKVLAREERLPPDRVARILLQTLAALREAHLRDDGESLLHLDLKPQNLFIQPGRPEKVKVIDFGIGQHVGAEAIAADQEHAGKLDQEPLDLEASLATVRSSVSADQARSPGSMVKRARGGTVLYSSPEQCAHLAGAREIVPLDGRSDLYSLGVMAFKMLTGHHPWKDWSSLNQGFKNHVKVPPRKVTDFGVKVPRKLVAFIDRCLEKDRDDRWKDTAEAYDAMYDIVHPPVWPKLVAVFAPLLLVVAATAWWFWPEVALGAIELRLASGNSTRSASSAPIYLGEARPSVELQVGKLVEELRGATPKLLAYPEGAGVDAQGVPLDGWELSWASDGRLQLAATDLAASGLPGTAGGASYGEVAVRVDGGSGSQESARFRLVVMQPGGWDVSSLDVGGGLGARALEPAGLDLELTVDARLSDLDQVEIHHPGASSPRRIATGSGRELADNVTYTVPLDVLDLPAGHSTIEARVTDLAGGVRTHETELDVVKGALALGSSPILEGCREVDGRWIITPNSTPVLKVSLARPAAMTWALRGGSDVVAEGSQPTAADHRLELSREDFAAAGRGGLRMVFDESSLVMHAGGTSSPGVLEVSLPFTYLDVQPEFALRLDGAMLDGERYLTADAPALEVVPSGERVPTEFEVLLVRESDGVALDVPSVRVGLEGRGVNIPIALPADGVYLLEVRGSPLDVASGELLGAPTIVGPYRMVLDRAAPELAWALDGEIVLSDRSERAEVLLEVQGTGGDAASAAMPVEYRLVAPDAPGGSWASGTAERTADGWRFALPTADALGADGGYRLDLRVLDDAGNRSAEVTRAVVIATRGPQLTISQPNRFYEWEADAATRRWLVTVRSQDANGTASVTARVQVAGKSSQGLPVVLERSDERADDSSAAETEWSGGVVFDHSWSGLNVQLVLTAEDGRGVSSTITGGAYRLPAIARERPSRLAVTLPGRPVVPMRPLSARGRADYLFHGRLDETENEDYRRWGLPLFNTKFLPLAWKLRIPVDALPEIYLDERETTDAEFLAFVRAADGWSEKANWPRGQGSEARRSQLQQRLGTSVTTTPDLPVTAVTWDEAAAYAHWVGKRLPTLVEWEVAVRGAGPGDYRPYASHGTHSGPPSPDLVNYDPEQTGASKGPWPASRGEDECADTGLRNLCSNVAEWTASPGHFAEPDGNGPGNIARHFADHIDELLDPQAWIDWGNAKEYWVVGGSFRKPSVDFSFVVPERRSRERSDVGFRCALDVSEVFAVMEGDAPGKVERLDR